MHAPWGVLRTANGGFATAEERNYPKLFCRRIARQAARNLGVEKALVERRSVVHRIGAGLQPRRDHKDLVPEFKEVKEFEEAADSQILELINGTSAATPMIQLGTVAVPKEAKVLNVWESGSHGLSGGQVGIQWPMEDFVTEATKVQHPFDEEVKVPQRIAQAIYNIAKLGPKGVAVKRRQTLKYYSDLMKSSAMEEAEVHKTLHKDVEKIVKGKNILLFERMLRDVWYDDMAVSEILSTGVRLIWELEEIGI